MNRTTDEPAIAPLFEGGPLYRLLIRLHLFDKPASVLLFRILVACGCTWLPIVLLSVSSESFPYVITDIEVHARFLVSLPLLIFGEVYANTNAYKVVREFCNTQIISRNAMPAYELELRRMKKHFDTNWAELGLLSLSILSSSVEAETLKGWSGMWTAQGAELTNSGYWFSFVSMPVYRFLLLRWLYRILVWFVFLLRVSRLELSLYALHPDRMAGLEFLTDSIRGLSPFLIALGGLLSGRIANRIFHEGQSLLLHQREIVTLGAISLTISLGPLIVFISPMLHVRYKDRREYSRLAGEYVRSFSAKWLKRASPEQQDLLGTADIQALADMGAAYKVIEQMKIMPFGMPNIIAVLAATYVLVAPLLLTVIPAGELILKIAKLFF